MWQKFGGRSISQAAQQWENVEFSITPKVFWKETGKLARNQKVFVKRGDGVVVEMTTDAQGMLPKQNGVFIEPISVDTK